MSDLDTETTNDDGTTTFEHFELDWTVPTKRHLSHIRATKDELRRYGGITPDFLAETYLSADDFAALLELNPSEDDLAEFADKIADALGLGNSGN